MFILHFFELRAGLLAAVAVVPFWFAEPAQAGCKFKERLSKWYFGFSCHR